MGVARLRGQNLLGASDCALLHASTVTGVQTMACAQEARPEIVDPNSHAKSRAEER
jgi:hypothetical protein